MAGNFWESSHHQQWLLDRQDLIRERQQDLIVLTEEEYQKIFIFFSNLIQILGEQLKLRQQVIATATVFFKRFYARNSLKCIDPLLLAPTCVFLASKVEEFGVISNSRLITTCQNVGCLQIACVILQKDLKSWFAELNVDIEKIQEIARYVINLFELWKSYDEKKDIQGLLAKMPKPKTQPSR
ncbi:hypothetical protein B7P43_G01195 [Cryptotermes secundus]|uniref:Cyclin-like domain-containing protein n=1 Tax=Cryptotermes secundus TaxID=105785 RepID=A0A2J7PT95_9NEOP|nr:hypothetical protein B7P43_G01195 [Cryptotermes secundus]